jgi:hypothetical protein
MWKNIVQITTEYGACELHHTHIHTHTLRICNTYCFSPATMLARTRLNVMLQYICCLVVKCCKQKVNTAVMCESEV